MHILKDSKATRKSKHASHCCHQDLLVLFPTHTSEKGDFHRHHSVGVLVSTKSGLGNLTREEGGHRNTTVCWESLSCVVFFLLGVDNKKVIHIFMIYRIGFVLVNELKTSSIIMPSNIDVDARGSVPECLSPYTNILSRIPDTASISRVPNSWSVDTNRDIPSRVLHSEASSRISKTALSNTETSALALKKWKAKTWRNKVYIKGG